MKFSNLLPDLPVSQPSLQDNSKNNMSVSYILSRLEYSKHPRKIIVNYWFEILLNNYFKLLVPGSILVLLFSRLPIAVLVSGLASAGLLLFFALFFSLYLPLYHIEFLPHLDTCVEDYKGSQLEGIQECKKQQYSVVSLMLIQHILMEMAGLERPLMNTSTAQLLARQYGVSAKSIGPALQLILQWRLEPQKHPKKN